MHIKPLENNRICKITLFCSIIRAPLYVRSIVTVISLSLWLSVRVHFPEHIFSPLGPIYNSYFNRVPFGNGCAVTLKQVCTVIADLCVKC